MEVTTPAPWQPPATNPVLAVATRSERVESWHRGAVVIVHEGEDMLSLGTVDAPVYARSAIKPLQALPLSMSLLVHPSNDFPVGIINARLDVQARADGIGNTQRDSCVHLPLLSIR